MSTELKMHTENLVAKNIEKLTALFPNCITEMRNEQGEIIKGVDFDLLRQELSEVLVEGNQERYRLDWVGKKQAILAANEPIAKTLRPCREESVNFDTTQNLFIEGDNLDALKLLQETYLGKIKMIYIDPPYNTGNDFIYNDDFTENYNDFLERSNQIDEEGNRLTANTESNGRFHSDWLSMMYSRLKLARNLLSDDGVIFISIDDNEIHNLRKITDEIFGSDNFIAEIIRNTNSSKNQSLFVSVSHEYCLTYSKDINILSKLHSNNKWGVEKNNLKEYLSSVRTLKNKGLTHNEITEELKELTKYPRFIDFTNYWYFDDTGLYRKGDLGGVKNGNKTPIINPLTGKEDPIPPGGFRYSEEKLSILIKENRIHFHTDGSLPAIKRYLHENETQRPKSIMSDDQRPDYSLLQEMKLSFDNPKQMAFMKRILSIFGKDMLVMDFFAGSSTTAHAVMQLNAEDNGNRRFIMVQLPEKTDEKSEAYKAGYSTIAEISKERIRRAGNRIIAEQTDRIGSDRQDYALINSTPQLDIGFRVLKIDSTNMKDVYYTPDKLSQSLLDQMTSHIKEDRSAEDLLFQVMLDWGIELSLSITRKTIDNATIYFVGENSLVACFDPLTREIINEIAQAMPLRVVSCESAIIADHDKTNIKERFKQLSPDTEVRFL
ncbi:site-specific DNA-methyltransferase [Glaesserella parasuis]|uniref:site-specific DNA-methyltransferase n=1 Tax=Glaesserella parasuis TaxID=738 RepID=UPI001F22B5A7|nr:site-specific DNA-methyltransferase [Glaesserella parasuis]MDG6247181.1 site-specific DNA-methyltransferase [Glaesserella parasuis]MDP0206164.1 site-specific DNA-methyltransferase [Glaesserella parasuis]